MRDFVADPNGGDGMLPLMGGLPDMKADSNRYILVQNWFSDSFNRLTEVIVVNSKRT